MTTTIKLRASIDGSAALTSIHVLMVPRPGEVIEYDGTRYQVAEVRNQAASGDYGPRLRVKLATIAPVDVAALPDFTA